MTDADLTSLLAPPIALNPEGIYDPEPRAFDLDVSVPDYASFALWLDGNTKVVIPVAVTKENAIRIQSTVRALGREVVHTWGMQYSATP